MAPQEIGIELSAPLPEVSERSPDWLKITLIVVALAYAFLAGLRTVTDFDLGWQLATGRWVVQNQRIPSTDVFSFTAQGQPWIYPVLSGLLFYAVFVAGGYVLLSWIGAAACVGTVGLLLRRGAGATAALAILATPLIAARTGPRADMFTVILFAAFLSLLWQQFQTGRARLWVLPVLMAVWVNLHLGFIAGFALIGAYLGMEALETLFAGARRRRAIERVRRAWPWLLAAVPATFLNPWGWNLYVALVRQNRAMAQHAQWITEWASTRLNWNAISSVFSIQETKGAFFGLLAAAIVAAALAVWRRQPGVALLLAGASYMAVHHARFQALFGCVVTVAGGGAISAAWEEASRTWQDARMRKILGAGAAALFVLLALARSADLVTERHYLGGSETASFGAGLSWWFPERALAFVEREHLPAQIFNNYNTGGFLVWRLGKNYRDYVDGRALPFGPAIFERQYHLMQTDPDSPEWKREAERYGINTIILSLARYDGDAAVLPKFCASESWKPVYLDEVSVVFLRQTPANEPLIQRWGLDCAKAALPELGAGAGRAEVFHHWANAMLVLHVLGRNQQAWAASTRALNVFPANAHLRYVRAMMLSSMGRLQEAEREYQVALNLEPNDVVWSGLASLYRMQGRTADADQALANALDLSTRPHLMLTHLAFTYVLQRQPKEALAALEEAVRRAPPEAAVNQQFQIDLLRGRAAALDQLGQGDQAIALEEQAARRIPDCPDIWAELANFYLLHGRTADAERAKVAAGAARNGPPP